MKSKTRVELENVLNTEVNFSVERCAEALYSQINTPVSLGAYLRLKYGEISQLVSMSVKPTDYLHIPIHLKDRLIGLPAMEAFFDDRVSVDFLRKYAFPGDEKSRETRGFQTFVQCEQACEHQNSIGAAYDRGQYKFVDSHNVDSVIDRARRIIAEALGAFDVEEMLASCRLGPGVNLGDPATSDIGKFSRDPSVTEEFEPMALAFLQEYPGWCTSLANGDEGSFTLEVYPGGKFATVPKDAKTDRCIETQPLINSFAQAGVGRCIRKRLKAVKIDLDDQSRNQELARIGSLTGRLATIDLSNASDLISKWVVKSLIPSDWYQIMDWTRTHRVLVPNRFMGDRRHGFQSRELARFSSMGNGFTFELETLIFWAVTKAACEHPLNGRTLHHPTIGVYGDDIICPASRYQFVTHLLHCLGFSVNLRKSFSEGPFRESCGADWWMGTLVRPLFLKERPLDVASCVSLANGLRRVAGRLNRDFGYDRRLVPAYVYSLRRIPPALRKRIAVGYTETDDFIFGNRHRLGSKLVFRIRRISPTRWYPVVAAALYRAYAGTSQGNDDFEGYIPRIKHPIPTGLSFDDVPDNLRSGRGEIHDYRRDDGTWSFKQMPHWMVQRQSGWDGWW